MIAQPGQNVSEALWRLSVGASVRFDSAANWNSIRVMACVIGKDYGRKYTCRSMPLGDGYEVWRTK